MLVRHTLGSRYYPSASLHCMVTYTMHTILLPKPSIPFSHVQTRICMHDIMAWHCHMLSLTPPSLEVSLMIRRLPGSQSYDKEVAGTTCLQCS